ncbi:MAG: putative ester cyclase [Natronomonas sp.]|jgi:predicted ester cyclase
MATMEQRHKDLSRRFHEEVWGNRNLEYIDEQIAADFIGHDPGLPEPVRGPEGVRETAEMFQSGFPDAEVEIEHMVAEDSLLAVHRRLTGTHEGAFMGIEPTGMEIEVPGIAIYRFEDGNIVEEWQIVDNLGLFVQLGVVEPPNG